MKFRISVKDGRTSDFDCGYCALQTVLNYEQPFAYSVRREGWACDYYNIDGIVVSTGYAPHGKKEIPYEVCEKYEKLAMNKDREQRKALFLQMIKEV